MATAILASDWLISKKASSLKPLCQMNRNLVGSIYGRSSIANAHFFFIVNKHGHHRQFLFLIGRFLKKSFSLKPLGQINRNLVGSIYGRSSIKIDYIIPICKQTWLPQAILVSDWLISEKASSLKLHAQINRNLVENILGRSSIKIVHFVLIR
jgi:hypothetical protein